jgi:hypothetical protein
VLTDLQVLLVHKVPQALLVQVQLVQLAKALLAQQVPQAPQEVKEQQDPQALPDQEQPA